MNFPEFRRAEFRRAEPSAWVEALKHFLNVFPKSVEQSSIEQTLARQLTQQMQIKKQGFGGAEFRRAESSARVHAPKQFPNGFPKSVKQRSTEQTFSKTAYSTNATQTQVWWSRVQESRV